MSPWPKIVARKLHGGYIDGWPTGSLMPHIQPDDQKITDTHRCANTKTHTAATVQSHSKSLLHLWSHRADALDRKPSNSDPWGGLEFCQQLGAFQHPQILFRETHQLSSLTGKTPGQTSADTQVNTRALHAHKQTNQGHQAKWNLIWGNKLIRFASIWCVLWIRVCGFMWVPNPGHELHSVWIIKLPQFW